MHLLQVCHEAQGGVVERRVPPYEEPDAQVRGSGAQEVVDGHQVGRDPAVVPCLDSCPILLRSALGVRAAVGVGDLDQPVRMTHVSLAQASTQQAEVAGGITLVGDEEHVDAVHGFDGGQRQLVLAATADADHFVGGHHGVKPTARSLRAWASVLPSGA